MSCSWALITIPETVKTSQKLVKAKHTKCVNSCRRKSKRFCLRCTQFSHNIHQFIALQSYSTHFSHPVHQSSCNLKQLNDAIQQHKCANYTTVLLYIYLSNIGVGPRVWSLYVFVCVCVLFSLVVFLTPGARRSRMLLYIMPATVCIRKVHVQTTASPARCVLLVVYSWKYKLC